MTGFDIIVLLIVAVAAAGGFMRGFVQEMLSLAAWILALLAIRQFHTQVQALLEPQVGSATTAAIVAFALLLLIPFGAVKLIASMVGTRARDSLLGPLDRVLGFGFGAVKGAIIVVIGFALLVLGYDTVWGEEGRPNWIVTARTYPSINAGSEALVGYIHDRRAEVRRARSEDSGPVTGDTVSQ
ncbi:MULTISPECIES: CvpA family protein [Citromicrobium]|uniref:CvpA family protein n=1 Tax=Citromicrobium TaxID=72173 RepID=UPI0001DD05BB|nr:MULTISPECIES: CvpA family protein [Citromicrobium]ALG61055.1 colicin V production protein [Citromicrobium sp. JL477]KPM15215.1 colicin V production protein [Citromicrobium sp. JL1351]KPM19574.1 colicin V production protein [Citromicrobium sp. JL31]KPM26367.1 colicin V production protein [Citromicrobium sp. JL2201]